jgi:ABC-type sugar transport system permease subunit
MAAVPAPARKGGGGTRRGSAAVRRRHTLAAWMFALPFMVLFLVFMAGPVLASLTMSFTDLTSRDLRNPWPSTWSGWRTTPSCCRTTGSCARRSTPPTSWSSASP